MHAGTDPDVHFGAIEITAEDFVDRKSMYGIGNNQRKGGGGKIGHCFGLLMRSRARMFLIATPIVFTIICVFMATASTAVEENSRKILPSVSAQAPVQWGQDLTQATRTTAEIEEMTTTEMKEEILTTTDQRITLTTQQQVETSSAKESHLADSQQNRTETNNMSNGSIADSFAEQLEMKNSTSDNISPITQEKKQHGLKILQATSKWGADTLLAVKLLGDNATNTTDNGSYVVEPSSKHNDSTALQAEPEQDEENQLSAPKYTGDGLASTNQRSINESEEADEMSFKIQPLSNDVNHKNTTQEFMDSTEGNTSTTGQAYEDGMTEISSKTTLDFEDDLMDENEETTQSTTTSLNLSTTKTVENNEGKEIDNATIDKTDNSVAKKKSLKKTKKIKRKKQSKAKAKEQNWMAKGTWRNSDDKGDF